MKNIALNIKAALTALFFFALILNSSAQRSADVLWSEFKNRLALQTDGMQSFDYDVVTKDKDSTEKKLGFSMITDGYRSRIEFTAPDDMKGTRLLYLDSGKIYSFLPAYSDRIRRLIPNAKTDLMGMALSNVDLNILGILVANYEAGKVLFENKATYKLELTPKKELISPYASVKIVINSEDHCPLIIECFDSVNYMVRTIYFSNYTNQKERYSASQLVVVDHLSYLKTTLTRKTWLLSPQVDSSIFLKKNLSK